MDYLVATHNKGKRDELVRILSPLGIKVHLPDEIGIALSEPVEDAERERTDTVDGTPVPSIPQNQQDGRQSRETPAARR